MAREVEWEVTRSGHTVRIDIHEGADLTETDAEAILTVTEKLIADDGISIIQMDGPELHDGQPPEHVAEVVRSVDELAHKYGKPMTISPM